MLRVLGIVFVGIWAWDEAAVRVNASTGSTTLPFLWGGIIPGSKTFSKYLSEVYLMVIGFVLILLSAMGGRE